jgi:hypothetical protein
MHSPTFDRAACATPLPVISPARLLAHGAGWVLVVFLGILVARQEVLRLPPYWDAAYGLWLQGASLARSNLNFVEQWLQPTTWHEEGFAFYRFNVIPLFIAALLRSSRTPTVAFCTFHLLVFVMAAATVVLATSLIARTQARVGSIGFALALLTMPLFSTQIDMMGMEMFVCLGATTTAWCIGRGALKCAVMVALASYFFKASALVLMLAVFCYLVFDLLRCSWNRDRPSYQGRFVALVLSALSIMAVLPLFAWGDLPSQRQSLRVSPIAALLPGVWCCDVAVFFVLAVATSVYMLMRHRTLGHAKAATGSSPHKSEDWQWVPFGWIYLLGTLVSYTLMAPQPRYFVHVISLLFAIVAVGLSVLGISNRGKGAFWLLVAGLNLVNWNGSLYCSPAWCERIEFGESTGVSESDGCLLERSRAYLKDLRGTQAAMSAMEQNWDGSPVFSGFPYTVFMAFPELGYVSKPLAGYATTGIFPRVESFCEFPKALESPPTAAYFLHARNAFYRYAAWFVISEPDTADEIIYQQDTPMRLVVYRRLLAASDAQAEDRRAWLLARLGPDPSVAGRIDQAKVEAFRADLRRRAGLEKGLITPRSPRQWPGVVSPHD